MFRLCIGRGLRRIVYNSLIIEKLMEVQETYPGLERVNVGGVIGTPQNVILEQLEWFGREVMPAFKGKVGASSEAD